VQLIYRKPLIYPRYELGLDRCGDESWIIEVACGSPLENSLSIRAGRTGLAAQGPRVDVMQLATPMEAETDVRKMDYR
jgi:hypothetical protein